MTEPATERQETGATLPPPRHHGTMILEEEESTLLTALNVAGSLASLIALSLAFRRVRKAYVSLWLWLRDWWQMCRRIQKLKEDVAALKQEVGKPRRLDDEYRTVRYCSMRVGKSLIGEAHELYCAICHEKEGHLFPLRFSPPNADLLVTFECPNCGYRDTILGAEVTKVLTFDLDAHFAKQDAANDT